MNDDCMCNVTAVPLSSSLPWGPGGCQRAGAAWCWACLWAVWWHPSLSDKPPGASLVLHDRGLPRPGSQTPGSGPFVLDCLAPIASSVPSPGSTRRRLRRHYWPRSPATLETLQRHTTNTHAQWDTNRTAKSPHWVFHQRLLILLCTCLH